MNVQEICPCPNMECPNHGFCDRCTSRHLRQGHLNYCGFQTVLPTLMEAINEDPECATAKKLKPLIDLLQQAYQTLMEKNNLTDEGQHEKLKKMMEYSKPSTGQDW